MRSIMTRLHFLSVFELGRLCFKLEELKNRQHPALRSFLELSSLNMLFAKHSYLQLSITAVLYTLHHRL